MILSAQSIRLRCATIVDPMIHPFTEKRVVKGKSVGLSACSYDVALAEDLMLWPGRTALASTVERFHMPADVCGFVCDKSSYARLHVSCFNTLLDPGWRGNLTLEIAYLKLGGGLEDLITLEAGDPICQIVFHLLDDETEKPYRGKFQDQEPRPVRTRFENADGTYSEM